MQQDSMGNIGDLCGKKDRGYYPKALLMSSVLSMNVKYFEQRAATYIYIHIYTINIRYLESKSHLAFSLLSQDLLVARFLLSLASGLRLASLWTVELQGPML